MINGLINLYSSTERFLCVFYFSWYRVTVSSYIHCVSKKGATFIFAITLANVDNVNNSFTVVFSDLLLRKTQCINVDESCVS